MITELLSDEEIAAIHKPESVWTAISESEDGLALDKFVGQYIGEDVVFCFEDPRRWSMLKNRLLHDDHDLLGDDVDIHDWKRCGHGAYGTTTGRKIPPDELFWIRAWLHPWEKDGTLKWLRKKSPAAYATFVRELLAAGTLA